MSAGLSIAFASLTLAQSGGSGGGGGGGIVAGIFALVMFVIYLAIIAAMLISLWKVYVKAGRKGWEGIVPIYNIYVLTQIVGRPWWWLILCLIPVVNIIPFIILCIDLALSFGRTLLFGIGLALLGFIFFPILAFGKDTYKGPSATGKQLL